MKEFQHEGRRVESEIRVNAPAERVWRAWAEAEEIQRWFTDGATGRPVPGEVMTWSFDNFAQGIPYTVVEAMPGEKFSIGFEGPDGRRGLLEITLRQEGGETVVRLVNSGFRDGAAWDEEYEGVRSGWVCALAVLKLYLEMYAGKNKTTLLAMEPAEFEYADLRPWYTDPAGVEQWTGIPPASLRLLADSGREVVYEWADALGTLECKAFQAGPRRMLCVRVITWAPGCDEGMLRAPTEMLNRLKSVLLS